MIQKRILLILIVIILLPALFYTAYEINSLSENEELVQEIYQQQMNTLLYSVNQYAWDVSSGWADKINLFLDQPEQVLQREIKKFINIFYAIETVFIADTTIANLKLSVSTDYAKISYRQTDILKFMRQQRQSIQRLFYRKKIGYTQIESYIFNPGDQKILLVFISDNQRGNRYVIGMILNTEKFIQNILVPRLNEITRNDFMVGIFYKDNQNPLFANEAFTSDEVKIRHKIWLFPDHYLGVKLQGETIEDIARSRFNRSIIFIGVLVILLVGGAWLLYKNVRRAIELARLKSDFVSNVSHQLRTPLALIRLFVETLELNRVDSDQERMEYYQVIGQETERLTHLLNNILDFSKMEAGKKQYRFQREELNEIVQHTLNVYKFHLENNGFALQTAFAPAPLYVQVDQQAIEEAIINLLDNAIKYSHEQKNIVVRTGTENSMAFIEVEDQGIGIPQKEQARIFEKFYRVSSGLTQETKGSGLGLSLVKYIVDGHKGFVKVNSEPGRGSRFRLLLPMIE